MLGAFDFFPAFCSVYIDRHIRVNLSDDEQFISFTAGKSRGILATTDNSLKLNVRGVAKSRNVVQIPLTN